MTDSVVADLSARFVERIGDGIGRHDEIRFVGGDRDRILVLDRYEPHLRLFDLHGDSLWFGGWSGSGPRELGEPQSIAPAGDSVLVLQRGRISRWLMVSDSLAFDGSYPMHPKFLALGAESGCGGLIVYARNDEQFWGRPDTAGGELKVDYMYRLELSDDTAALEPFWTGPRPLGAVAQAHHSTLLFDVAGGTLAVLHRPSFLSAGRILEFECSGALITDVSELELVTGDGYTVRHPRERATQWTGGITAFEDGFAVALSRFFSKRFYDVEESHTRTELILFRDGRFAHSVDILGLWSIGEHVPGRGLLLESDHPVPHFLVVPDSIVRAVRLTGDVQ